MNDSNAVRLHGTVDAAPVFSHGPDRGRFFRAEVRVPRLSGMDDVVPVLLREGDVEGFDPGKEVTLAGSLRSYNNKSGVGRKLVLDVLVDDWREEAGEPSNELRLRGTVCRAPVLRRTPLGRSICDVLLAVPRPGRGKSDYLPVIAWGRMAYECSERCVGDGLAFDGRFQSRGYRKVQPDGSVKEMTAYEVSMGNLVDPDGGPVS